MDKGKKAPKRFLKVLRIIGIIIAVVIIIFLIWAADYYRAEKTALAILENENVQVKDGVVVLSPNEESDEGFIFYPGGKVEAVAYLPILQKIVDEIGMNCYLVEMPLNLAFFNSDAAKEVMQDYDEIEKWYVGGHSLGGAMASDFASKNPDLVEGLVVMGAYVYGDYPTENALTVYGTFNSELEDNIDYTDNIVIIEGGNHAQFGNYGKQSGDEDATISAEEQQDITVDAMAEFFSYLTNKK